MRKIPFLRILIAFIIGIFLNQYWNENLNLKFGILSIASFSTFILYKISKKRLKAILPFGISLMFAIISLGIFSKEISFLKYNKAHYTNFVDDSKSLNLILKVNSKKVGKWNCTYEVEVLQIKTLDSLNLNVIGKLQLVTRNQSLEIDDIVNCKGLLQEIEPTYNRFTFDYKKFLKRKYVVHKLRAESIELISREKSTISSLRQSFKNQILALDLSTEAQALIQAMLLGDKSEIKSFESIFRSTGTSHVLAISGLHVGIIATILFGLVSFLPVTFSTLKYTLIILGVWAFCLLSGLAPSTVRASIMVSCFLISKIFKWNGFGFNFCFIACFFMLLMDPNKIFDIGFQFSFLAVVGILLLYEPMYKFFAFKGMKDKLWQMTVMSLSAQVAITPLSLFYFHEFPLLFLPASCFAIPATFVIIAVSLILLGVNSLGIACDLIKDLLDWFINLFLDLLNILASLDALVVKQLYPTTYEVAMYYLALAGIISLFLFQSKKAWIVIACSFVSLLSLQFIQNKLISKPTTIIYAHENQVHIDFIYRGLVVEWNEANITHGSRKWFSKGIQEKYKTQKVEEHIISTTSNDEIITPNASIYILNTYEENQTYDHDYVLLNTEIEAPLNFSDNTTVIDFANNNLISLNNSFVTNQQIILN